MLIIDFINNLKESVLHMKAKILFSALIALSAFSLTACGGESAQKAPESTAAPVATSAPQAEQKPAAANPEQAKAELQQLFTWYEGSTKKLNDIQQEVAQKTQEIQAANPNDAEMKSKMATVVKEHSQKQISQFEAFLKELDGINTQQAESQELKALFQKNFKNQIDMLDFTIKMVEKPDPSMKAELESKTQVAMTDAQNLNNLMMNLQQKYAK
ncbi:hypothetical protein [Alysiella crassa]|uniref:Lipoprotein n=2 Tax=Alysiella crassa TaxID=153491 RepID=A0A376BUL5_9NEIS|nr:hypothetical protein [Alysiella crassa]UOP06221.1 hypothetical protein LVJ80_10390 [Alysiella crassa]SSY80702.1 Uncharacterised protein [Alysiella crassa]